MSPSTHRQRLLALLTALPEALPILVPEHRSHPDDAMGSIEHLAIDVALQGQSYCIVHSLMPELAATAVLECRFGAPPAQNTQAIYRRMLELNWRAAVVHPFGLSIDAARGEVLLSSPLNLQQASAADLAALLSSTAQIAAAWRATGFLDVPQSSPAPSDDAAAAVPATFVRA